MSFLHFTIKDLLALVPINLMVEVRLLVPFGLTDPDSYLETNMLVSPEHIRPEWYFLFAYAILRRIPNKLGGTIALVGAVLVLYLLTLATRVQSSYSSMKFILVVYIVVCFIVLTFIGMKVVTVPFVLMSMVFGSIWFLLMVVLALR